VKRVESARCRNADFNYLYKRESGLLGYGLTRIVSNLFRSPHFCACRFPSSRMLPPQREAGHRWLHPFGEQGGIEIVKGTRYAAGLGRRTFKDAFQIMIVVLVETAKRHGPLGSLQLTLHVVTIPRCCAFPEPSRCTPTVAFWCETGAALASARSAARVRRDCCILLEARKPK
jgi:hypothetical protein